MNPAQFEALAREGYNRITLVHECPADLDTPLSVYMKLANRPDTFLLESVEGGTRFARYSFIGLAARQKIRARITPEGPVTDIVRNGVIEHKYRGDDPLKIAEDFLAQYKTYIPEGLPRLTGGLIGYFGYDTVRLIEPGKLGKPKPDDLGIPDIELLFTDELVAFDNLKGRLYIMLTVDPSVPNAYENAKTRMRILRAELNLPAIVPPFAGTGRHEAVRPFAREDYLAAVRRAKDYIAAGDLMQVQIGQRIERPFDEDPVTLYRALRAQNPSPYMYCYRFGTFAVVGASPEILVRSETRDNRQIVAIRPIAGTRRRDDDPAKDRALAEELRNDPKERAEHLMLIDLARNDIGRIAKIGTVRVTEQYAIERYSQVQHLVSHVEGELKDGMGNIDVLRATFPAGTLTGAPKIRAMEIIDELEPVKRGVYGGAVGYLSFAGDMDMAITIRTALIKDGKLYAQAAAGIVADSVPEFEWKETEIKARAVLRAADAAEAGLEGEL